MCFRLSPELLEFAREVQEAYDDRKQWLQDRGEYNIPPNDDGTWVSRDKTAFGLESTLRSMFQHILDDVFDEKYDDAQRKMEHLPSSLKLCIRMLKVRDNEPNYNELDKELGFDNTEGEDAK